MTWQPAVREPDSLATLVHDSVRANLFPGELDPRGFRPVPGESWRQAVLPDGTVVRADLAASPATQRRHGPRACAGIRVTGVLTVDRTGYRVAADVCIDLATRAVLSCDARIEAVSP